MSVWLTDLADILRGAGVRVQECPGWRTHGHGAMSAVQGVLWHHTAGPPRGRYPSLNVVRDGRPGLSGPLAQLGLGRDGTWYVIAAGMAYHAGDGAYPGITGYGNSRLIGVEAENTGTGQPWPAAQLESYRLGTAALLAAYGLDESRCIGHKEWAPQRKIDPYGLNMDAERAHVANYMRALLGGGIEDMAFTDTYTDWAGNPQTVQSWMDHVDQRILELHRAVLALQQSRIPGDDNTTNAANLWFDAGSWQAQTLGRVTEIEKKIDKAMAALDINTKE